MKNLVGGFIAVGLIISGGTGLYLTHAKAKTNDPVVFMSQQGVGSVQMSQMMNSNNKEAMQKENCSFEQMRGADDPKSCVNQGKVAGNK